MAAAPHRDENAANGGGWSFGSNAMFYILITLLVSNVFFQKPPPESTVPSQGQQPAAPSAAAAASNNPLRPLARPREPFTITVETEPPLFAPLTFDRLLFDHDALMAVATNVTVPVDLAACFAANCSVALTATWRVRNFSFSSTVPLIRFYQDTVVEKRYLFGAKSDDEAASTVAETGKAAAVSFKSYFQPEVTLSPVVFFENPLPDAYREFTPLVPNKPSYYGPLVYINNFWMLREHYIEVNASTVAAPLTFTVFLKPASGWKVLLYTQFDKSLASQPTMGFSCASEAEETKRLLLDVSTKNPILLAVTAIVTALHTVFEFLAFSNDVKFWRGKKDFRGLSVRSIVINCYFQSIIFLYLLNGNETSWAVLLPSGIGAVMEYWKLAKTVDFSKVEAVDTTAEAVMAVVTGKKKKKPQSGLVVLGYRIGFKDSYDSRTQKHDDVAVRYLIYAMIPLLAGNAVYSALYKTHRNWYSFLISTQVQFIYSFGFAQMTPQIFINYKMKSVGQLPWRSFIYKSLNTVIDDLFAFVIKMPWLHRLACFQDDVVFAILLYQRWIYPVDMTRFDGESGAEEMEETADVTSPLVTEAAVTENESSTLEAKKNQ